MTAEAVRSETAVFRLRLFAFAINVLLAIRRASSRVGALRINIVRNSGVAGNVRSVVREAIAKGAPTETDALA